MNGWIDMQLARAQARSQSLASEARSERLARTVAKAPLDAPSLRVRLDAAVAAWKQPSKVSAA